MCDKNVSKNVCVAEALHETKISYNKLINCATGFEKCVTKNYNV